MTETEITDTQRLDWLIKQGPPGVCESIGLNGLAWDGAMEVVEDFDEPTDKKCIRAAIDKAITQEIQ